MLYVGVVLFANTKMANCNLKFLHANVLRAADLRLGPEVMFSDNIQTTIDAWCPLLRMDSVSSSRKTMNPYDNRCEYQEQSEL